MVKSLPAGSVRRGPNLPAQVYDALRGFIASGALRPGERIILDRLAEHLGVSHTPVREALARLVQEGIVVGDSPGKLHLIRLTPEYVQNTYVVRSVLEGLAAELAVDGLSVPVLQTIRSLMAEIGEAIDSPDHELRIQNDTRLHRLLWETAGNPVLLRELHGLETHIGYIRSYSLRHSGDHIRTGHAEHLSILESLEAGNAHRARQGMEEHIRNTSRRIVDLIEFEGISSAAGDSMA